jgi:hypothetical protein
MRVLRFWIMGLRVMVALSEFASRTGDGEGGSHQGQKCFQVSFQVPGLIE